MLSCESSFLFYEGVVIAHDYGFAPTDETFQRLAFLLHNTASGSMRDRLLEILPPEFQTAGTANPNEADVSVESRVFDEAPEAADARPDAYSPLSSSLQLQFFVSGVPEARRWEFHQYDRDYFPSIPHGHRKGSIRKLDAYRGWVYERADQVERESRKLIIALWNDNKFREFARKAILFYMSEYPRFLWRVRQPLRLPRH